MHVVFSLKALFRGKFLHLTHHSQVQCKYFHAPEGWFKNNLIYFTRWYWIIYRAFCFISARSPSIGNYIFRGILKKHQINRANFLWTLFSFLHKLLHFLFPRFISSNDFSTDLVKFRTKNFFLSCYFIYGYFAWNFHFSRRMPQSGLSEHHNIVTSNFS